MPFEAKENKPFETLTEEIKTFNARIIHLIDLGTHEDTFEGVATIKHSIRVGYELVDTAMADGQPFMLSETFNVTPSKFGDGEYYGSKQSNLKARVNAIAGTKKDFVTISDVVKLLGTPCRLTVKPVTKEVDGVTRVYSKIIDAMPPKGDVPNAVNPIVNAEFNDTLPENLKGAIKKRAVALEVTDPQRVADWRKKLTSKDSNIVTSDFVPTVDVKTPVAQVTAPKTSAKSKTPVVSESESIDDDIPF